MGEEAVAHRIGNAGHEKRQAFPDRESFGVANTSNAPASSQGYKVVHLPHILKQVRQ